MRVEARMMDNYKQIALVLCGGGAKGAYQIGVWRYLKENGYEIEGISGASVGSLNALLIAQNDIRLAEEAWHSLKQADLTCPRLAEGERDYFEAVDALLPMIELYLKLQLGIGHVALFSQYRLRGIIQKSILDWDKVRDLRALYVSLARIPRQIKYDVILYGINLKKSLPAEYVSLHYCSPDEIMEYVLISSAIPGIYKPGMILGDAYVDGGFADNIPVRPLVQKGFSNIVIVHLQNETDEEKKQRAISLKGLNLSGCVITDIYPSVKIQPMEMLIVNQERIRELMECGYHDARDVFEAKLNFRKEAVMRQIRMNRRKEALDQDIFLYPK